MARLQLIGEVQKMGIIDGITLSLAAPGSPGDLSDSLVFPSLNAYVY